MKFIAGSGRSGTTWVLDCLADANGLRPVFEPLHPARSSTGLRYAHRLIEPGESHPELRHYLETVQGSNYWSLWTTYRSPPERMLPSATVSRWPVELRRVRYRWKQLLRNFPVLHVAAKRHIPLLKCIRANLALGWLVKSFDARVILILRHPCAVVESQLRLGEDGREWNPWPVLNQFRMDGHFTERTQGAYQRLLESDLTKVEALTLLWVIENQWAVDHAKEYGYNPVYYEKLLVEPETQWRRLCDALVVEHTPTPGSLQRPSQQSSPIADTDKADPSARWMDRLDRKQLGQIQRILDQTRFGLYQVTSARPLATESI